jgi:uncharacterized protein
MTSKSNAIKEFQLSLFSLKDKVHDLSYVVDNQFFEQFEYSLVSEGKFEIEIKLDKSDQLLQFDFKIKGIAKLTCDRSLEDFDFPIEKKAKILFKFGKEYEEVSDDVIILEQGTNELNIAPLVYELITVEIPYKKLHPKFQSEQEEVWEDEEFGDELELVYSDQLSEEEEDDSDESSESNEQWEQLKKKFNKE